MLRATVCPGQRSTYCKVRPDRLPVRTALDKPSGPEAGALEWDIVKIFNERGIVLAVYVSEWIMPAPLMDHGARMIPLSPKSLIERLSYHHTPLTPL